MAAKKPTIGDLIDRLARKRAEIKAANDEVKRLKEEEEKIEADVLAAMDAQGTLAGASRQYAAAVSESVVPQVTDWDAFYSFIYDNRWFHLLQRRTSTPGCRELFEAGKSIPGVDKFTKRAVNLRSK